MPGSVKAMAVCTVASLFLVTAYSVALGASGPLWLCWVVLGLLTVGAAVLPGQEQDR